MFAITLLVLAIVVSLIATLPTITIDPTAVTTSSAYEYVRAACYFIPANTVLTILTLILAFWVLRVVIALVKMLWDMLPVS